MWTRQAPSQKGRRPPSMEGGLARMFQSQRGEGGDIGPVQDKCDISAWKTHRKFLVCQPPLASWDGAISIALHPAPAPVLPESREQCLRSQCFGHPRSCQALGQARSSKSQGATKPQMPTGHPMLFPEPSTPKNGNTPLKSKSSLIVEI